MDFYFIFLWMILWSSTNCFGKCPHGCQHENTTLKCYGIIPNDTCIAPFTKEVIVLEKTFVERFNFTGKGWKNVKSLSLNPELYAYENKQAEVYKDLHPYEFKGLENLEKLQIACRCLRYFYNGSFGGLDKLRVLDLSNNENLNLYSLQNGFVSTNLTTLSELYLSNTSHSVLNDIVRRLEPDFFGIIKDFPLKVLDVSGTYALTDSSNQIKEALLSLKRLNLSNSGPLFMSIFSSLHPSAHFYPKLLRVLDLSYLHVPFDIGNPMYVNALPFKDVLTLHAPNELIELYIKKFFKNLGKFPPVTTNSSHLCLILQTNIRQKNLCFVGKAENLKKLVAAENSVSYFDVNLVNLFPNVRYLDISSNLLGDMISSGLIHSLLEILLQLETLILSNNEIYTLPSETFPKNSKLRYLDLSYNNLESITSATYNLPSTLTVLDLRYNKITVLDALSIERLTEFLNFNSSRNFNDSEVRVLQLTGNPFSCSCDHIHSLQWLAQLHQGLACKLDSEEHTIDDPLVKKIQYNCKLHIATVVYNSYASVVIIVVGVLMYYMKYEYKRFTLRRKIKKAVRRYSERQNKQVYPVFLSFCCEDDEIVMKNIHPNLERGLQKILKTDSPCVATGYSTFRPGYSLAEEIIRCVEASSVVVFFVTNQFCRKAWCRNETLVAHYENKSIILMLWEEIDLKLMPRYLYKHYRNHARVHWILDESGQRKMRPGWDELCEVIVSRFAENTNVPKTASLQYKNAQK